jgi:hypothetical protein
MLYKDVNLINTEIEMYRTITRKRLELLQKISKSNQRLVLDYVPSSDKAKKIIQNHHEKNNIYTIKSILTLALQGQIIRNQPAAPPTIKIGKSIILYLRTKSNGREKPNYLELPIDLV